MNFYLNAFESYRLTYYLQAYRQTDKRPQNYIAGRLAGGQKHNLIARGSSAAITVRTRDYSTVFNLAPLIRTMKNRKLCKHF